MTWEDKNKIPQCSKLVVTVSNWHFNRDTLKKEKAPVCKLEDIMVTLKLSSTVFDSGMGGGAAAADDGGASTPAVSSSPGTATNGGGGAATSQSGESYFFDKNGAIIPYSAFVSLLESDSFHDYLRTVKRLFKGKDCEITPPFVPGKRASDNDNDNDDDDDDVAISKVKRRRRELLKKMREGTVKKAIAFDTDDEDDILVEPPSSQPESLGVTPLPSENEESENDNDADAKKKSKEEAAAEKETGGSGGSKEEKSSKEARKEKKK
jgi:hypothetical protein